MSREQDAKIYEWLGHSVNYVKHEKEYYCNICGGYVCKSYTTSDGYTVTLLSVLVERGHHPEMYHTTDSEGFSSWYFQVDPGERYHVSESISAAISSAVLALIDREAK
jgi:hypothetical protein